MWHLGCLKIDDIGICNLTSKDVVRHPLVQKSFRHMMIMKISRLQRLQESRGRAIEKGCITNINFISILALSFVLCLLGDVYPDEWICMGF